MITVEFQKQTSLPHKKLLTPTKDPNTYELEIDNTSLETFNTCARSSEYRLVYSRGSEGSSALHYGTLIHEGLETWYKTKSEDQAIEAVIAYNAANPPLHSDWRNINRAVDSVQRYIKTYGKEHLHPVDYEGELAVELRFRLPLCTIPINAEIPYGKGLVVIGADADDLTPFYCQEIPVFWTGKIDLIANHNSDLIHVDHKTSSMLGATYWEQFQMSQQMIGYTWACHKMGMPVTRTMINVIYSRPPLANGTEKTEFHRENFTYQHRVNSWETNTSHLVADFLSHLVHGTFPQQTAWCVGKYGKCPYFDVCTLPDEDQLSYLFSPTFSDITWNPLKS